MRLLANIGRRCSPISNHCNSTSAWIKKAPGRSTTPEIDVAGRFCQPDIHELLRKLTGVSIDRTFSPKRIKDEQRPVYELMSTEKLTHTMHSMTEKAKQYLHMIPFVEPRSIQAELLGKDEQIAGFDTSMFVFTDISYDATDRNRTVTVRETDGTLRLAFPEEHDRMNRIYFDVEHRPPNPPAVFDDPHLTQALDDDKHEFVLDWACWFYQPDHPDFVKLCCQIFDHVNSCAKFDNLWATRHFGSLLFYLCLNRKIKQVLIHYARTKNTSQIANIVRLYRLVHPDWRHKPIMENDDDSTVIDDFLDQNSIRFEKVTFLLKGESGTDKNEKKPKET